MSGLTKTLQQLQVENDALRQICVTLHWTSRRYCDGRSTYITQVFNEATRALLALGLPLIPYDGTLWARDRMGRAYDGLTDAEAAEGEPGREAPRQEEP